MADFEEFEEDRRVEYEKRKEKLAKKERRIKKAGWILSGICYSVIILALCWILVHVEQRLFTQNQVLIAYGMLAAAGISCITLLIWKIVEKKTMQNR